MENISKDQDAIESFKHAKIVFMITENKDGEMHSRPMTNFNENPYAKLWFPSYNNTRKVEDIKENPKIVIIYPGIKKDQFYEIDGKAEFADRHVVEEQWVWWYLYWHPEMNDFFWFDQTGKHPERVIININPTLIKRLSKDEIKHVKGTYSSLMLKK